MKPTRAELTALVGWALLAAKARARLTGLAVDEAESAALRAVEGALRNHDASGAPLEAYVRLCVRWVLLDLGRSARRRGTHEVLLEDLEEPLQPGIENDGEGLARTAGIEARLVGSPEESLLQREEQAALDHAVDGLARADGRLYELRHREGLTWDAIATTLGIPARTLRLHDKRIRAHLAAVLRASDGGG